MKEQDYKIIEGAFKEAEKDDTPFLIASEGELVVAGDANKTQKNSHDFVMKFRVPDKTEEGVQYKMVTKEFKDVYITPRQDTKIVKMISMLIPYFKKIENTGEVTELSQDERRQVFESLGDEVYDAMYDVVGSVLGIDKALQEYMMPVDVLNATAQIITQYPEVVNESDTFFG